MIRIWRATGISTPIGAVAIVLLLAGCSASATPTSPASPAQSPSSTAAQASEAAAPASEAATSAASAASVAPASSAPAAGSVTGTWSGPWTRDAPLTGGGTMTLHLQQDGSNVTGDITVQGSVCLVKPGIPLTGTFNDPTLVFTVTADNVELDYTATLAGSKLSGKLAAVKCPAGLATGTFELTRP
jgi:hypothetical protein